VARKRDYRAEYAARQARARARGFGSYADERRAGAMAKRRGLTERLSPAQLQAVKDRASRRQIHETAAGRGVSTTARGKGYGVIGGQLRGHGSNPVTLYVRMKDGSVRTTYARGRAARDVLDLIDRNGGGAAGVAAVVNGAASSYDGVTIEADDIESVDVELLEGWPNR